MSGPYLTSVTLGAATAERLAAVCNRAHNLLSDLIEADEDWSPNEREREMLSVLAWASDWLRGRGIAEIERRSAP